MTENKNTGAASRFTKTNLDELTGNILGPKYSEYRDVWYSAQPDNIPDFPIHLDLELLDDCNKNCWFCPRNKETHLSLPYSINTKTVMSDKVLNKIYDEIKRFKLHSINISFGEPLLYKKVFNVIEKFHDLGVVDSILITNGLLINKFYEDIFNSGLVHLYISIDAYFDTIILRDSLHHLFQEADFNKIKQEIVRVSNKNARLIFFDPNLNSLLRILRFLSRHKDAECSFDKARNILGELGYTIIHKEFNTIFSLPLSGGYIGINFVPQIKFNCLSVLIKLCK